MKKKRLLAFVIGLVLICSIVLMACGPEEETPVNIPVTGITLDNTTLSVVRLQNAPLVATVMPADATNQEIEWSSSDMSIVSFNSRTGRVTGEGIGSATITATTKDGNFKASCTVTVTPVPLTGLSVNSGIDTNVKSLLFVLNTTQPKQLTAVMAPSTADNVTVIWASSVPGVATVSSSGLLTAVGVGTTKVSATSGTIKAEVDVEVVEITGPIPISTAADFEIVRENLFGDYYLKNDIDFEGAEFRPLGANEDAAVAARYVFGGTFDGRGYSLKNIQLMQAPSVLVTTDGAVNRDEDGNVTPAKYTDYCSGFFSATAPSAVIRNLALENITSISAAKSTALFVGTHRGLIENCSVSGTLYTSGTNGYERNGGVVGRNGGTIRNFVANINRQSGASIEAYMLAGFGNASLGNGYMDNIYLVRDGLGGNSNAIRWGGQDGAVLTVADMATHAEASVQYTNLHFIRNDEIGTTNYSSLPDELWTKTAGQLPTLKKQGATPAVIVSRPKADYSFSLKMQGGTASGTEFNGDIFPKLNTNYSFTIARLDSHVGTPGVTYMIGSGSEVALTGTQGTGANANVYTFTIPAASVTGNINIGAITGLTERTQVTIATPPEPETDDGWAWRNWTGSGTSITEIDAEYEPFAGGTAYVGLDVNFAVRVSGTNYTGTPTVSYKVGNGAVQTLTPVNSPALSGFGTGDQNFLFTIPGASVTGEITITGVSGITKRADDIYKMDISTTMPATSGAYVDGYKFRFAVGSTTYDIWSGNLNTRVQATDRRIHSPINFTVRVNGNTYTGIPSITYVIGGGAAKTITPTNTLSGIGTGDQDFSFTIPGNEVTGNIVINAVTGLTARSTVGVTSTATLPSGFTLWNRISGSSVAFSSGITASQATAYNFAVRSGNQTTTAVRVTYTVGAGAARTLTTTSFTSIEATTDPVAPANREFRFSIPASEVIGAIVITKVEAVVTYEVSSTATLASGVSIRSWTGSDSIKTGSGSATDGVANSGNAATLAYDGISFYFAIRAGATTTTNKPVSVTVKYTIAGGAEQTITSSDRAWILDNDYLFEIPNVTGAIVITSVTVTQAA